MKVWIALAFASAVAVDARTSLRRGMQMVLDPKTVEMKDTNNGVVILDGASDVDANGEGDSVPAVDGISDEGSDGGIVILSGGEAAVDADPSAESKDGDDKDSADGDDSGDNDSDGIVTVAGGDGSHADQDDTGIVTVAGGDGSLTAPDDVTVDGAGDNGDVDSDVTEDGEDGTRLEEDGDGGIIIVDGGLAQQGISQGVTQTDADAAVPFVAEKNPLGSKRRFVSYTPSLWENVWIENVEQWAKDEKICDVLTHDQAALLHDFLNMTCTVRYLEPYQHWCIIDDGNHPLWYNAAHRATFDLHWSNPLNPHKAKLGEPHPISPGPEHEDILSKFRFLDETTGLFHDEYIEPLVSHLRFPLARCMKDASKKRRERDYDIHFRGFVIPPPASIPYNNALYFDVGATQWVDDVGGKSLGYLYNTWKDHGVPFDKVYAFESKKKPKDFYKELPYEVQQNVEYVKCTVASSPDDDKPETPFVPQYIKRFSERDDYVVLKLDVDGDVSEEGNIEFIIDDIENTIDEIIWEHHVEGNYLLRDEWGEEAAPITMSGSYAYFLALRRKGIRAHSWV